MVNKVVSSAMDREFDLRSGQTKDYKSDMCCFFTNHAAYRINEKTALLVLGLWWLTPLSTIFQLYRGLLGVGYNSVLKKYVELDCYRAH
jgi:hypothetical protein